MRATVLLLCLALLLAGCRLPVTVVVVTPTPVPVTPSPTPTATVTPTRTPTPTPTVTPTPTPDMRTVTAANAVLFVRPDATTQAACTVPRGYRVHVLEQDGDFLRVSSADYACTGWIRAAAVTP